jgi:hypothetical protein
VAPLARLTELVAHGGVAGALVELGLVLVLLGVGAAVWWRGRGAPDDAPEP